MGIYRPQILYQHLTVRDPNTLSLSQFQFLRTTFPFLVFIIITIHLLQYKYKPLITSLSLLPIDKSITVVTPDQNETRSIPFHSRSILPFLLRDLPKILKTRLAAASVIPTLSFSLMKSSDVLFLKSKVFRKTYCRFEA